ncbi:uncharacterized protein K441DRAFT_11769 [Cenococcum geophilum 1.58]|uniref:uncharacterized protein n=1 Tax=Cenococcum geophilum 1.58 TaxID=794803 RepID=UPI00358EA0E2|nr:hypothetical protein K441DRAFT_11769 [Cenococcum geophilum 1.58]
MKSASTPPRGGAREPKQTQRRAYGCAAPALRRRGGAKSFLVGRYTRITASTYTSDPLLLMRYNDTVRHLHAAKPYTPRRRKAYNEPLIQTALYSLYTLIHLAYSNT